MFRFTIRELVLVMLVVALALGWWLHYRRTESAIVRLEEMLRNETSLRNNAEYQREALYKRLIFEQDRWVREHPIPIERGGVILPKGK
jgi:hypothetical protein